MNEKSSTRMTIDIPNNEHRHFKAIAASSGLSMKSMLLDAVRYINRNSKDPNYYICEHGYEHSNFNDETRKSLLASDEDKGYTVCKDFNDMRTKLDI